MKPLFFCRKCLIKGICNKKCDTIRSILHVLNILQSTAIVVICLSWAMGFGLSITMEKSKAFVAITFSLILIGSISFMSIISYIRRVISDRFNRT